MALLRRSYWAVKDAKLEGIVAKKLSQRYWPGERHWVKVRNRDYLRFGVELEGAERSCRSGVGTR
jgi:ATP-dependent DNA ligase